MFDMFHALIALCGILTFMSIFSKFYPLKWVAGFSWWGILVYWISADLVVDGTPTDVIWMLVFIMLGLVFMLWGFTGYKGRSTIDVDVEYTSGGKVIKKTVRSSSNPSPRNNRESAEEYRVRVNKAAVRRRK